MPFKTRFSTIFFETLIVDRIFLLQAYIWLKCICAAKAQEKLSRVPSKADETLFR